MPHAKLAPSSAARRMACPGSRALEEKYPQTEESLAAREGTAAHWVASESIAYGKCIMSDTTPHGEFVTEEMLEGAELYTETIASLYVKDNQGELPDIHIESRVDISNVHPECYGTPDCWFVVNEHLHVIDYKFGHGYVDVYENWQLLEYAAGIIQTQIVSKITLTIVQPRCYTPEGTVRSWTITAPELYSYISRLKEAEAGAMQPDAVCIPSPECKHCSARHACAALSRTVGKIVDTLKQSESFDLTPSQTSRELRSLKHAAVLLDARMTGLEEQTKAMITRGELVPGFKLEPVSSREQWTKDREEIITLGEMMGIPLSKPAEPITPAQARKAGIPDEILTQYAQRFPGKLKLVEETRAGKVFKSVDTGVNK